MFLLASAGCGGGSARMRSRDRELITAALCTTDRTRRVQQKQRMKRHTNYSKTRVQTTEWPVKTPQLLVD